MDTALEVHRELGHKGQNRNVKLPDLIIAATAELTGATVLHHDRDYERIAAVTGQAVERIVPPGSL
jgi:predicted nucleic acid-binding protein